MARTMIAPMTDMIHPAAWPGPYNPSARPMNVPTNAPTMPNRIVMMIPPGSLPAMTNLSCAPTMSLMMMVQMIDMLASHREEGLYDAEPRLERLATTIIAPG